MKIFGIGLSRTGTTSLSNILKAAGINVIHYPNKEALFSPDNDGACDIPAAVHFKELDAKFPNSKFIYTVRNREDWLESMEKYLARKTDWKVGSWMTDNRMAIYGQMTFDRELYSQKYDEHDKNVREYFKDRPNDLLIIDIVGGDDARMLWRFLEFDYDMQFPHANKRTW